MSLGIDWRGSPHAYVNAKVHEEARVHSSWMIVLKCAKEGKGRGGELVTREEGGKLNSEIKS